jgi:hypothetical protein
MVVAAWTHRRCSFFVSSGIDVQGRQEVMDEEQN